MGDYTTNEAEVQGIKGRNLPQYVQEFWRLAREIREHAYEGPATIKALLAGLRRIAKDGDPAFRQQLGAAEQIGLLCGVLCPHERAGLFDIVQGLLDGRFTWEQIHEPLDVALGRVPLQATLREEYREAVRLLGLVPYVNLNKAVLPTIRRFAS